MKPTTAECYMQSIIDGLNPGDRVKIRFNNTTTVVEATLVPGDYGSKVTYQLGGPTKYTLSAKQIENIEIIQRARPKLAVGDRFKYVKGGAFEYIVLYISNSGQVRAIHPGQHSEPFILSDDEPIIKI